MHKVFLSALRGYKQTYLIKDAVAALVVTAIAIPESLAFAAVVGVPLQAGLYTAVFAPIIFALFAHTKRLVVGADSATAALVAAGAGTVAAAGTAGYGNAVLLLGIVTSLFLVLAAIFKLGFLSYLISRPVLVGFFAGVGVQLILTNTPKLLGIPYVGPAIDSIGHVLTHLSDINWMAATISVLVFGVIMISRHSRYPGELIGLVLAMVFAAVFRVENFGVSLVGALPSGLPSIVWPDTLSLQMLLSLVPAALSIALVILAQSSSVIRSSASEHDESVRLNQDLMSLGFANAVSAFSGGFAVNGSPPRSLAADTAGGKTQMVNIIMGSLIGIVLLVGGEVFRYVPFAALAAIVFAIGLHLIRLNVFVYLWQTHRSEFLVAAVALVGVVLLGVREGVLVAIIISLIERLSRQYHPKDQVLLRDGEFSDWAKERIGEQSGATHAPKGVLIYRFDGALFFENAAYFISRVSRAIERAHRPVRYCVIDAGAIDSVDYTAVEELKQLYRRLSADGIMLGFAHVSPTLHEQFAIYGVIDLVGEDNIYPTLSAAMRDRPETKRSAAEKIRALSLPKDSYVAIGGAVMEGLGLRDTKDIDLVVDSATYKHYRDEKNWKEYTNEYGKRMLSHHGYNLMHSWGGRNLGKLQRMTTVVDGIPYMGLSELIKVKRHIGRKKDLTDIAMLEEYLKKNR